MLAKKGAPKKGDLKSVQAKLETTIRELGSNVPYLVERFNGYMDDVYHDAAARFEGYLRGRAKELGLDLIREGAETLQRALDEEK